MILSHFPQYFAAQNIDGMLQSFKRVVEVATNKPFPDLQTIQKVFCGIYKFL